MAPPGAQWKLSHEDTQNSPAFSNAKMSRKKSHFRKGKDEGMVQAGLDRDATRAGWGGAGREPEGRTRVRKKSSLIIGKPRAQLSPAPGTS